jgi:hypothetical protein
MSPTDQFCSYDINSFSASLDILCIYGNRMSITVFTTARHLSLSRTRWIHFTSRRMSLRSILILNLRRYLGLGIGVFLLGFPYCNLHAFLFSRFRNTYTAHIFYLYLITLIMFGDVYKSRRLSFRNYLQLHLTSSTSFHSAQCLEDPQPLSSMWETTQISFWTEWKLRNKTERSHKHSATTCNEFILYKCLYT